MQINLTSKVLCPHCGTLLFALLLIAVFLPGLCSLNVSARCVYTAPQYISLPTGGSRVRSTGGIGGTGWLGGQVTAGEPIYDVQTGRPVGPEIAMMQIGESWPCGNCKRTRAEGWWRWTKKVRVLNVDVRPLAGGMCQCSPAGGCPRWAE